MNLESAPSELRQVIERDLEPVRPLHPAWMRALVAVAVMAVVLAFSLATASLRSDLDQIPMWLSWGCSIFQLALAVILIGMALREAIPGAGAPLGTVRTAALTALTVQILIGIATSIYSPAIPMPGSKFTAGIGCLKHEFFLALPTFMVILALVFRALPLRAPTAGLLGGAGAAIASDAILHLICPMSDLLHVLVWHTGAVLCCMVVGWLIGIVWDRVRWRRTP